MSKRFKIPNKRPRTFNPKTRYVAPAYLEVEVLPSGKLDAFEMPEILPQPSKPLTTICDCCLSRVDRVWILRHLGFGVGWLRGGRYRVEYQQGWWCFCVQCWALFDRREVEVLVARVCTLNDSLDPERVADVYGALRYAIYGEVQTWEVGQRIDALMRTQDL